ncbi:MAG TPA: hypothetical protein VLA05_01585 [Coriobacteriia bacterium]|nr:hypothetical protein [Coriobacteriia bacterium]
MSASVSGGSELNQAEIEALRGEVERLRAENLELSGAASPEKKARVRTNWAIVLVVIGAFVLALAPSAIWLRNMVFDTENWVETVAPLADDPAIQAAFAESASNAIIERLDAEQRIANLLPDDLNLDQFAPVLASSVEGAIRTQATKITQSEQFAQLWEEINRRSHKALLTAITGRQGVLSIESGTFTVDTGLLIDRVKAGLEERGLDFVARIPTDSLGREIVIFQSDALAMAGPVLDAIQTAAYLIPVLAIVIIAGAFALSVNKQRVALWFGIAVTIFGILPLQALQLGQYAVARQIESLSSIPASTAQSAYTIVFRDLVTADRAVTFFGIVIILAAIVAGPSRWAVALRSGLTGGLSSASSHLELGQFGRWVGAHKTGLRTIGFLVAAALLVALPAPRTVSTIVWLAVLVAVWLLAVEFLGSSGGSPAPHDAEVLVVEEGVAVPEHEPAEDEAPDAKSTV